jgi:NDMA-dependent alcohol dehydrogenase
MRSRAAILHEYGRPWSVEEFELDSPRCGEVLLQLAATGLCHSDEHIRQGKLAPPPETLRSLGLPAMSPTIGGHEGSGVVLEVGEGVTRFAPGDDVVTSFVAVCGQCRWCASGMEYLCDTGSGTLAPGMPTDGTFRHHTVDGRNLGHIPKIGAFAEHSVVSADSLVKIDQGFPLIPAALLACAVPTGYGSAARRANVRGGDTVVVIGAGGIGTAAIQGSRSGAARIVAVDPVDFKRESALEFGATHTASTAAEATEMVRELTRGVMADAVVVSPAMIGEADVGTALELTRKGGTCVLTGLPSPRLNSIAVALQDFILMNKTLCGTVFGSCNPKSDIPLLAALYESGQLLLDEMINKRYRPDEINEAYAD